MPYPEADLLPISALQHLLFCERQCALIHVERVWVENRLTAEGQHLHKKAHAGPAETRDGVRITRSLPLRSFELGLAGQADVVTWRAPDGFRMTERTFARFLAKATPEDLRGWEIVPVEYKRGKPKSNDCDRVQVCAQAMCLEEMLRIEIAAGDLFYGKKRRRVPVPLDSVLRETTRRAAARMHELMNEGVTPPARREPKCETCSLLQVCMPDIAQRTKSAVRYMDRTLATHMAAAAPETD